MIGKYQSEWVIPVLDDVAAFLEANGMSDCGASVVEAANKVRQVNLGGSITLPQRSRKVAPARSENVIRLRAMPRSRF